jgi:hypothetical protein
LLEVDALLTHLVLEPMMLIGAVNNPPVRDLQMPPVRLVVADRGHDARGFACLEDDHDCIGASASEVWVDEVIAAAIGASRTGTFRFWVQPFSHC